MIYSTHKDFIFYFIVICMNSIHFQGYCVCTNNRLLLGKKSRNPKKKAKQTREEQLQRKRELERKRKENIRKDPVKLEELRRKERERYHRKKAEGKIVPLSELPSRARRLKQKQNRINFKAYYERKKRRSSPSILSSYISPHNLPTETTSQQKHQSISDSPRVLRSCKEIHKTLTDQAAPIEETLSINVNQRSTPVNETDSPFISPNISSIHSPGSISAPNSPKSDISTSTSIFKQELNDQLRKYREQKKSQITALLKEQRQKLMYRKRLERLEKTMKISPKKVVSSKRVINPKTISPKQKRIRNIVKNFFEDDENSRICPGKQDYITRGGLREQKRYMNDSLRNLHRKYLENGYPPMSYVTFTRMRPFWVIQPRVENRETCMCKTHANIEFLISSLKNNKIIVENSITEVLNTLTCEKTTVACLLRKCKVCCNKKLSFKEFDNSKTISYSVWENTAKSYTKNNKEKFVNAIAKVNKVDSPKVVIDLFLKTIKPFMGHCGRIKNHYASIKKVKENLSENECLIHVDFSENYNTKYGEEVQTVHFAGGRSQITLHTSVIYYKHEDRIVSQPFCTISKSLRHDASAVWAHLVPIMDQINEDAPNVSTLHVVSDSPSTQYRNKKIFYIITQLKIYLPKLTTVVWHYSESGHGKGAPDGIGGVLKRTADRLVAFGKDIPDMETLVENLQNEVSGVKIKTVEDHEISVKDWLLPRQLKPFSGSMKVHQIVWNNTSTIGLAMRSLSCVEPLCLYNAIECPHGCHIGFYEIPKETKPVPDEIIPNASSSKQILKDNNLSINKPSIHCFKASKPFFLKTKNISQNKANLSIDLDNIIECENLLPSASFFENINSNILTQFEQSASDIAENKKEDTPDDSDEELTIFKKITKNTLESSRKIESDSDENFNIFINTKRTKKPPKKRSIINSDSDEENIFVL